MSLDMIITNTVPRGIIWFRSTFRTISSARFHQILGYWVYSIFQIIKIWQFKN